MTAERDQSGDCPEDLESVEEEETVDTKQDKSAMQFNHLMATLQSQQNIMAQLPPSVKRRVKALKKIQLEATNIEAQFFKEVHDLECKYHLKYVPLYEKRSTIVNGAYEPNDEEADFPSEDEEELSESVKDKLKVDEKEKPAEKKEVEDPKGVPDFWLTVFRNISMLADMLQPHDIPIIQHLTDIKTVCSQDPMGFTLEFHFSENEYFTNPILTKTYEMKCVPDEDDPFNFEGPEIYKCSGCTINWNKGKNVTLKTIKKKQKHKSRGVTRTVIKTVQSDSFFNFFNPPAIPEDTKEEDVDEELRNLLTADFEIGHYIRERIVPRAVLFFTGEAIDEEEDFEEEEDEEDSDYPERDSDTEDGKPNKDQCKQQ